MSTRCRLYADAHDRQSVTATALASSQRFGHDYTSDQPDDCCGIDAFTELPDRPLGNDDAAFRTVHPDACVARCRRIGNLPLPVARLGQWRLQLVEHQFDICRHDRGRHPGDQGGSSGASEQDRREAPNQTSQLVAFLDLSFHGCIVLGGAGRESPGAVLSIAAGHRMLSRCQPHLRHLHAGSRVEAHVRHRFSTPRDFERAGETVLPFKGDANSPSYAEFSLCAGTHSGNASSHDGT